MGELREGRPELDIIIGLVAFGPMCDEGIRRLQTAYVALPPFLPWIKATISAIVKEQTREVVYEFRTRERALQPSEWDCQPQEWGLYRPPSQNRGSNAPQLGYSPPKLSLETRLTCSDFLHRIWQLRDGDMGKL